MYPESTFNLPVGKNPDLSNIKKVLVIVAHPDDIDYGCAGTIALFTNQGIEVSYCLVTSGDAGGDQDILSRDQRIELRESEQTKAGQIVGVNSIHFLRLPDGKIEANLDLRERITRVIRKEKPDIVITQSPVRRYDRIYASHPDHLAVGEATICAVYPDSQNPHAFENLIDEGHEPHQVKAIWIMADEQPDTFMDISNVFEMKIEALFQHVSQIDDQIAVKEMVREWCANMALIAGYESGALVESFRFVQISL